MRTVYLHSRSMSFSLPVMLLQVAGDIGNMRFGKSENGIVPQIYLCPQPRVAQALHAGIPGLLTYG